MDLHAAPYPPLTSVIAYPLHPEGIYPESYVWACEAPERPRDNRTVYDWRCQSCVFMASTHITIHGDQVVDWRLNDLADPIQVTQSWLVARSLYWLGLGRHE